MFNAFQEPQQEPEEARQRTDAFPEQHLPELQEPQVALTRKDRRHYF